MPENQIIEKPNHEVLQERTGTNPFEWRTFDQPVKMAPDKWSHLYKPTSSGKVFAI